MSFGYRFAFRIGSMGIQSDVDLRLLPQIVQANENFAVNFASMAAISSDVDPVVSRRRECSVEFGEMFHR